MHRVDAPGAIAGLFTDGNPAIGQQATQVRAAWLNDLQENVVAVIEAAGITLEKGDANQLLEALAMLRTSGSLIGTRVLTANGTYHATAGTRAVEVTVIGGGGGGGGAAVMSASQFAAAGGGGSGGWGTSYLVADFDGVAVVIGAGGTGGVGGAVGGAGGSTLFGGLLSATGGQGGAYAVPTTVASIQIGGFGGTCAGANRQSSTGSSGDHGIALSTGNMANGGGGHSLIAAGGATFATATSNGQPAGGFGAGGSGAEGQNSAAAQTGGAGGAGVVIIREYA
ncbi:MAG TPA: hypothetical protein VF463_10480 [Sphingobium sp.]